MTTRPARPKPKEWSPRFWEGSDFFAWLKLLAANRFAVAPPYWYIAGIVSGVSLANTVAGWFQRGLYGRRIRATAVTNPPLFVIGHWRTGTTLLHELFIRDPQFAFPDVHTCFCPSHFLISERVIKRYGAWLMPDKRPMDNMPFGWDRPQEDEFALALLGQPSTYADVAFPNRRPAHPGALDLSGLTPEQVKVWQRTIYRYVQALTVRDPRRQVLKSPPHTARVPTLLDVFPDAKFVHVVRDPRVVFPSTVNLWLSMARKHGFQTPKADGLEDKVVREFATIYARLEEARPLLRPGHFHELRYEELVRDPVGEMEKAYTALQLDGFAEARPRLEQYARDNAGYETNKYTLTPAQRERVEREWGDVIRRYGY